MATTTRILVINPGSTSTKIAIYQQEKVIFLKTIKHPVEELKGFKRITDQYEYRKNKIHEELKNADIPFETIDAVIAQIVERHALRDDDGNVQQPSPGMVSLTEDGQREYVELMGQPAEFERGVRVADLGAIEVKPSVLVELGALLEESE